MTGRHLSPAERCDWLRLSRSENVGPATFHALIRRFGTAEAALESLPSLSARGGHRGTLRICSKTEADEILERAETLGARFIASCEPDYPPLLRHIDSAPPLICAKGRAELLAASTVAIVGARNASATGRMLARRLAAELGQAGLAIVSGFARGIDTAAHEASLDTGTIAVMAGGIDVVYPPENEALAGTVGTRGMLVTEMMPGTQPQAKHFPRRNRLIAGLSLGVVVIEAAERSGSLITARLAAEQGREVLAVPGSPLDPRSAGTNRLIRQGATLVTSSDEVLEALRPMIEAGSAGFAVDDRARSALLDPYSRKGEILMEITDEDRRIILSLLGPAPVEIDDLIRESGQEVGAVYTVLLELELAGRLTRCDAARVALLP